jgi:hypothetical protein
MTLDQQDQAALQTAMYAALAGELVTLSPPLFLKLLNLARQAEVRNTGPSYQHFEHSTAS